MGDPASRPRVTRVEHLRAELAQAGIRSVGDLPPASPTAASTSPAWSPTASAPAPPAGVTFLNLEDETGMLNVVCSEGVWRRYRQAARNAVAIVIRGILERQDGVTNLVADKISSLASINPDAERALKDRHQARNFH